MTRRTIILRALAAALVLGACLPAGAAVRATAAAWIDVYSPYRPPWMVSDYELIEVQ